MTYCLAIALDEGIVFASDSRTNAGVDYVSTFSKMHVFTPAPDRLLVLLTAGNLATSQEVLNRIRADMAEPGAEIGLHTVRYMFEAADYVGHLSRRVQQGHADASEDGHFSPEASFIIGGQLGDQEHSVFLVYPEGNYIQAAPETPFLQIGESKYGKPILDRIIDPTLSLEDAARCALVSIDSTMRSNISVGPPIELAIYRSGAFAFSHRLKLTAGSAYFAQMQSHWNRGLRDAFNGLPPFDWETRDRADHA